MGLDEKVTIVHQVSLDDTCNMEHLKFLIITSQNVEKSFRHRLLTLLKGPLMYIIKQRVTVGPKY